MRAKCFVAASGFWQNKIDASALAVDNTVSADTALVLNGQWRRLLPALLVALTDESIYTGDEGDIETAIDNAYLLIESLYADIPTGGTMTANIGDIKIISHTTIPADWLLCDGSAISRATYADLFALIGVTYGNGDGTTTFNLPELRGRTVIGAGNNPSLTNRPLGANVGAETHTLNQAQMPAHTHTTVYSVNANPGSDAAIIRANVTQGTGNTIVNNSAGGGNPHNNMQPSTALNYIIKVQ